MTNPMKPAAYPLPEVRDEHGEVIHHGQFGVSAHLYVATQLVQGFLANPSVIERLPNGRISVHPGFNEINRIALIMAADLIEQEKTK